MENKQLEILLNDFQKQKQITKEIILITQELYNKVYDLKKLITLNNKYIDLDLINILLKNDTLNYNFLLKFVDFADFVEKNDGYLPKRESSSLEEKQLNNFHKINNNISEDNTNDLKEERTKFFRKYCETHTHNMTLSMKIKKDNFINNFERFKDFIIKNDGKLPQVDKDKTLYNFFIKMKVIRDAISKDEWYELKKKEVFEFIDNFVIDQTSNEERFRRKFIKFQEFVVKNDGYLPSENMYDENESELAVWLYYYYTSRIENINNYPDKVQNNLLEIKTFLENNSKEMTLYVQEFFNKFENLKEFVNNNNGFLPSSNNSAEESRLLRFVNSNYVTIEDINEKTPSLKIKLSEYINTQTNGLLTSNILFLENFKNLKNEKHLEDLNNFDKLKNFVNNNNGGLPVAFKTTQTLEENQLGTWLVKFRQLMNNNNKSEEDYTPLQKTIVDYIEKETNGFNVIKEQQNKTFIEQTNKQLKVLLNDFQTQKQITKEMVAYTQELYNEIPDLKKQIILNNKHINNDVLNVLFSNQKIGFYFLNKYIELINFTEKNEGYLPSQSDKNQEEKFLSAFCKKSLQHNANERDKLIINFVNNFTKGVTKKEFENRKKYEENINELKIFILNNKGSYPSKSIEEQFNLGCFYEVQIKKREKKSLNDWYKNKQIEFELFLKENATGLSYGSQKRKEVFERNFNELKEFVIKHEGYLPSARKEHQNEYKLHNWINDILNEDSNKTFREKLKIYLENETKNKYISEKIQEDTFLENFQKFQKFVENNDGYLPLKTINETEEYKFSQWLSSYYNPNEELNENTNVKRLMVKEYILAKTKNETKNSLNKQQIFEDNFSKKETILKNPVKIKKHKVKKSNKDFRDF